MPKQSTLLQWWALNRPGGKEVGQTVISGSIRGCGLYEHKDTARTPHGSQQLFPCVSVSLYLYSTRQAGYTISRYFLTMRLTDNLQIHDKIQVRNGKTMEMDKHKPIWNNFAVFLSD